MTVRAHARRDLALILRTAWPEAENHHHTVTQAEAPRVAVHPLQVITGERRQLLPLGKQAAERAGPIASVLADVGGGFAAVLRVPGPAELGSNWRWEADGQAAPQWDARVDELVSSFWSVHYNDSQITDNAVFVWAPWLVAMAFGARATARRRGLVLRVRQRPSYGAARPHRRPRPNDVAHDFIRREGLPVLADVAALHEPVVTSAMVTMTIKPLSAPLAGQHGCPGGHGDGHGGPDTGDGDEGPLLLIVRVTHGPVGPIPLDLAKTGPFTIYVSPSLARRVIPAGTWIVRAHEWLGVAGGGIGAGP